MRVPVRWTRLELPIESGVVLSIRNHEGRILESGVQGAALPYSLGRRIAPYSLGRRIAKTSGATTCEQSALPLLEAGGRATAASDATATAAHLGDMARAVR